MRKIALVGFDNLLGKCFELVLKSILNESASICLVTEEKIRKDYAYDFIILHSDKATPDSSAISLVRELRKNKCLSPIIAFVFSENNIHRIFSEDAHKHIKYPIIVNYLKEILKNIRPINPDEIHGFYKRIFCDRDFLNVMLSFIPHDVNHCMWKDVSERIGYLEVCHGIEITKNLHSLLNDKVTDISRWENETIKIRRIFDGL